MPAPQPMPKEIAGAIVLVMRAVGKLAKESKNQHGGYRYASVDAFLEATNPACAEAGLIIMPIELEATDDEIEVWDKDGRSRKRRVMRFKYAFQLVHESGEVWMNPRDVRSVILDYTGPQTFNAAQSYALKVFMRGLFQIPTGDPDADAQEQHQAEIIRATVKAVKAKKENGVEHILLDFGNGVEPVAAPDVADRVMQHLVSLGDKEEAAEWWQSNRHGREQFHNAYPKLALSLKKKVERFISGKAEAAE